MKEKLNFTLDPERVELIDQIANRYGISRSAALNFILIDYGKLQEQFENGWVMYNLAWNENNKE